MYRDGVAATGAVVSLPFGAECHSCYLRFFVEQQLKAILFFLLSLLTTPLAEASAFKYIHDNCVSLVKFIR